MFIYLSGFMMATFFLLFLSALMTILASMNGQGLRSPERRKTAFPS